MKKRTLADLKSIRADLRVARTRAKTPGQLKMMDEMLNDYDYRIEVAESRILIGVNREEKSMNLRGLKSMESTSNRIEMWRCMQAKIGLVNAVPTKPVILRRAARTSRLQWFIRLLWIGLFLGGVLFFLSGCTQTVRGAFSDLGSACNYVQEQIPATDSR